MSGGARGAAVLLFGLLAASALAAAVSTSPSPEPASPPDIEPLGTPVVRIDKNCYFPTETVSITLRNAGFGRLVLESRPDFEVESPTLGTVRQILGGLVPRDFIMSPGETFRRSWDQKWVAVDANGSRIHFDEYVPDGDYVVHVKALMGGNATTLGSVAFFIGFCDVQVSAGEDVVVDEGQPFTLQPNVSDASQGNITSITWDADLNVDANGDGDPKNDADLAGENPTVAFGDDGLYRLALNVRGFLHNVSGGIARQDVVFAIDSSGSMTQNDPEDKRKEAAKTYVDLLVPDDRGAVVDFDTIGRLVSDHHLSQNYTRVKADIDLIDSFGGTFLFEGLTAALDELQEHGLPFHQWVMIFLSDAESIFEDDEILIPIAITRAQALGVRIFTIGLNVSPFSEPTMRKIAEQTGGQYFSTPDPNGLIQIYEDIAREVNRNRGTFFFASDQVTVTVNNVAPTLSTLVLGLGCNGDDDEDGGENESDSDSDEGDEDEGSGDDEDDGSDREGDSDEDEEDDEEDEDEGEDDEEDSDDEDSECHDNEDESDDDEDGGDDDRDDQGNSTGQGRGSLRFSAQVNVTDPGTDDVLITWDWGDGSAVNQTFFQDGTDPDPFESPDGFAVNLTAIMEHEYASAGTYTITITVVDDDGGSATAMIEVAA